MAQQTINIGTDELTGDGESLRSAFDKSNQNFTELYDLAANSAALALSDTAPIDPAAGDLWYDEVGGRTYVYYDNTWVDANPPAPAVMLDIPTSNRFYVNPWLILQDYEATGSVGLPFRTIAAAQAKIEALIDAETIAPLDIDPVFIVLQGNITEDITLTRGHVFLVGEHGTIHAPIYLTGTITINGSSTTFDDNHFSIQGISVISAAGETGIYFTGTNPQLLQIQDLGLIASGSGTGIVMDNTGSHDGGWSTCHGSNIKLEHSGNGDVYCIRAEHGTADFSGLETSVNGAEQIASASNGATITINNSILEAKGEVVVEAYDGGYLTLINCRISNISNDDSYGVWLHDTGCTAVLVNCYFSIVSGNANSRAIHGVDRTTVYHSGTVFAPSTNRRVDTAVSVNTLLTSFSAV